VEWNAPYKICANTCIIPFEVSHERHECQDMKCPEKCPLYEDCNRLCASEDHFHSHQNNVEHFCGGEHKCKETCNAQGICEIITELVTEKRTFKGELSSFEYSFTREQNGIKKACCKSIPPFQNRHEGPHCHSNTENVAHFCETKCPACGYYCNLPWGHLSKHSTTHGNMREMQFVSEAEDAIKMSESKIYKPGESCEAEMCNMYCKSRGRGHIHLLECHPKENGENNNCDDDGIRHQTKKYGPNENIPKDEYTHAAYWKSIGWEDPCSKDEQLVFSLCPYYCGSPAHTQENSKEIVYCTQALFHAPLKSLPANNNGYLSENGHHFNCDHPVAGKYHIIFVIDRSGSMGTEDIVPQHVDIKRSHNNRLGCVYEACNRFIMNRLNSSQNDKISMILFESDARVIFQNRPIDSNLLQQMIPHGAIGGTSFLKAIQATSNLVRSTRDKQFPVMIIFLSDGEDNNSCLSTLQNMITAETQNGPIVLNTVKFGTSYNDQVLMDMARIGNGQHCNSIDKLQLMATFMDFSENLDRIFAPFQKKNQPKSNSNSITIDYWTV